ncbi:DUF2087 domain-containing protein [Plantactinospora siamensis]|uniref:DUF2087 domain-containing protein n=1 Tax=Plantactinospora siamensis TaxID=555372 RepID=A0ABV6NSB0_9ACTN
MSVDRDRVLRTFLPDGRLVSMPARAGKRRVLLEHIVTFFEPGVRYPESEVNLKLRAIYPADWVALRRYLVDERLLDRADGLYWRIGGYVEV